MVLIDGPPAGVDAMRRGLEAKFAPGSAMAARLLATGDMKLVQHTCVSGRACQAHAALHTLP